jgi:hypothetical protein
MPGARLESRGGGGPLREQTDWLNAAYIAPKDNSGLMSWGRASRDCQVRVWSPEGEGEGEGEGDGGGSAPPHVLEGHEGGVEGIELFVSTTGRACVAVADARANVLVWDLGERAYPKSEGGVVPQHVRPANKLG